MTLREAIQIASGTLDWASLTAAEKAQVTGGSGGLSFADTIVFDPPLTTVTLDQALPSLSGGNDTISGGGLVTAVASTVEPTSASPSRRAATGSAVWSSVSAPSASGSPPAPATPLAGRRPADRNVLGNNSVAGILIETGANTVTGNYVGTNAVGTVRDPNLVGISITGPPAATSSVGRRPGRQPDLRERHPGTLDRGRHESGARQLDRYRRGRHAPVFNVAAGVLISGGTGNQIGDATAAGRNVISGNQHGVQITGATGTVIRGNFVGTNQAGTAAISNTFFGISVEAGANNTTIGLATTTDAARNVISGNNSRGIDAGAVSGLVIEGNFVGLAADGQTALPNLGGGIRTTNATSPRIGGANPGAGNYVSGNGNVAGTVGEGIHIIGPGGSATIQGNRVGLTTAGGRLRPGRISRTAS